MKPFLIFASLSLAFVLSLHGADPIPGPDQGLVAAIRQIQAQQVTIAENQAKIDAKLVALGEAVRVAKIYSSRGGR